MQQSSIQEQIWNYIDGSATAAEIIYVEKMLSAYHKQSELHQLLTNETDLEQPSMRFSKNVMDSLAGITPKPATKTYVNKYIIRSIAAFFILTIAATLIYALTQVNWNTDGGNTNLLPFDLNQISVPQLSIAKYFNSTVLNATLMVTLVLGLMFFDSFLRQKKSAA